MVHKHTLNCLKRLNSVESDFWLFIITTQRNYLKVHYLVQITSAASYAIYLCLGGR